MRTAAASTRTRSAGRRPAPSHGVSCVCDDASRRERRRRPRARRRVVSMAWTRSTPSTRRRRVAPMERDPLDTTDAGRGAPVLAAAAGEDAGQEVQDAHVPLRRGHVPLRRELLLRAQRRLAPRGTQNSLRAVDAKAGRSARRRSSGRSSPTSRRASRPTSSAGSSDSAPYATAAASRRPSSRSSSSRSCASRARSRPRPRCCWR